MTYQWLKLAHLVGMAIAAVKLHADRSRDARVSARALGFVVWADWVFTVPAGVLMPVTGLWMAHLVGWPWHSGWVAWGLALYAVAGLCWLPAAWLQLRMRRVAVDAAETGAPLPEVYWRWTRAWLALGAPAFLATAVTLWVMVMKRAPL